MFSPVCNKNSFLLLLILLKSSPWREHSVSPLTGDTGVRASELLLQPASWKPLLCRGCALGVRHRAVSVGALPAAGSWPSLGLARCFYPSHRALQRGWAGLAGHQAAEVGATICFFLLGPWEVQKALALPGRTASEEFEARGDSRTPLLCGGAKQVAQMPRLTKPSDFPAL